MARATLNVIEFAKYNEAIYPFDYYEECASDDTGALEVIAEGSPTATQILYNNDALIDEDGVALYAEAPTGKYVVKVLGFLQPPDTTSLEFEFTMKKSDEDYLLVVQNTALVPTYYKECASSVTGAKSVKASGATGNDQINYNDATLIDAYGDALYSEAPTDKYVVAVSGDKTITIEKGNSIQGVTDEVYTLRHGGTYYIRLESGKYKNVYGTDKGKVVLTATDTYVKAAVLCFQ